MNCYLCLGPAEPNANVCALHRPRAPRSLEACDPDFVAFRDHLLFGALPAGHVDPDTMERARHRKWAAEAQGDSRELEHATYALRRLQAHNAGVAP